MASRSAMVRLLIAAAVLLAMVHSSSAANIANSYKVTIQLQGLASDYLQVAKRNQFCTSFAAVLATGTAPLLADNTGCAIESAVNSGTSGEVTVTASFAFAAARADVAAGVVNPLNTALNSATPPSGFVKATSAGSTPVASAANAGVFPSYFIEVEIPTTTAVADQTAATAYGNALVTALTTAGTTGTTLQTCTVTQITPATTAASKLLCRLRSQTKTRSELLGPIETAVKAGVNSVTGLYARDTNTQLPGVNNAGAVAEKYEIRVVTVFTGTTASDLNTNQASLRSALLAALGNIVVDAANDIQFSTPATSGTGASTEILIKVASEASANRALEVLKQLLGSSIGTSPSFAVNSITSLKSDPPLFSGTSDTVYPGTAFRYSIAVTNTTSAFTTATSQFRRACEAITATLQGNASACSIVSFDRPIGDAGTLIVDITAANNSAALSISRSVARAVAAVPATTFAFGAVTEVFPTPPTVVTGSVVFTITNPATVDAVTAAVRTDLCNSLTGNGFVPASVINCFISESDLTAGTNAVQVTARVWWNLIDYTVPEFVQALNQAKTNLAFPTTGNPNLNTALAAGATPFTVGSVTTNFAFDADFHITTTLADFTTVQAAFAAAIKNIVGANAVVSVIKSAAATSLTPSTGTVVTVRVMTASAAAQAAALLALAPQISGTTTTLTTSGSTTTFTLQAAGFRRVSFSPPLASSEFPAVPAPPPPATPPSRPATPPATPPPSQSPQAPIAIPTDNNGGDATTPVRSYKFVRRGALIQALIDAFLAALRDAISGPNGSAPGSIVSITSSDARNLGKKFVVQDYEFTMTVVSNTAANAAQLGQRIATAINSGAVPNANVVSFTSVAPTTTNPTTPAAPTAPAAPPAPVTMTSGTIDITILGTRSSFTQTDQTALTSNIASAINGTASVINIAETSSNARKFTMQASALRLTTAVSAPASQYPTLDSIISRLLAVRTSQQGRLGNSSVASITASQSGAAARSGPVALAILVAFLVAMLSAMAQF